MNNSASVFSDPIKTPLPEEAKRLHSCRLGKDSGKIDCSKNSNTLNENSKEQET